MITPKIGSNIIEYKKSKTITKPDFLKSNDSKNASEQKMTMS